jgi:recombination protein RecA
MGACPAVLPKGKVSSPLDVRGVRRGLAGRNVPEGLLLEAFYGRTVELAGDYKSAVLTLAFRLIRQAQAIGEPAVWICGRESVFFPPDAEQAGIDLPALPVIRACKVPEASRAADLLLRSGAFGLVVLDLGADAVLPAAVLNRLAGLAKKHGAALILLTEKDERHPSLGSLVSLRMQAERTEQMGGRFRCEARSLKDKCRGPGWKYEEGNCRGPDGLY